MLKDDFNLATEDTNNNFSAEKKISFYFFKSPDNLFHPYFATAALLIHEESNKLSEFCCRVSTLTELPLHDLIRANACPVLFILQYFVTSLVKSYTNAMRLLLPDYPLIIFSVRSQSSLDLL